MTARYTVIKTLVALTVLPHHYHPCTLMQIRDKCCHLLKKNIAKTIPEST